jgi:hypothetical protein
MSRALKLESEGAPPIDNPSLGAVERSVSAISPRGPSYFILTDSSGSYVQVAGARLRLTVEYREVTPFGLRHFILGREPLVETLVSINYTGGAITLRTSEVLSLPRALDIVRTFYASGSVPKHFTRREATSTFR